MSYIQVQGQVCSSSIPFSSWHPDHSVLSAQLRADTLKQVTAYRAHLGAMPSMQGKIFKFLIRELLIAAFLPCFSCDVNTPRACISSKVT